MPENSNLDILLVEDNPGDISLITQAVAETEIHPNVHVVMDGIKAMRYLHKETPFENAQRPAIIILDINLPKKDGRAVLADIKSDTSLANIPVIIFSSSDAPRDISICYELHANCYIVKPRDLPGMNEIINCIVDFWLSKVRLPSDSGSQTRSEESK